ncbi:hypothetical protein O3P69_011552 [Scylla paramamosain]|uniref:Uncharacterized protein n=1 Tax=Scylla paramamosain TaxID=85552 RepID=A0AAW0T772_SCYPA
MRVEARLDGLSWSGGGGERWGVVCIPDKLVFCKMTCLADISSDKATTTTTTTMTLPEEAAGAVGFKEQLYVFPSSPGSSRHASHLSLRLTAPHGPPRPTSSLKCRNREDTQGLLQDSSSRHCRDGQRSVLPGKLAPLKFGGGGKKYAHNLITPTHNSLTTPPPALAATH